MQCKDIPKRTDTPDRILRINTAFDRAGLSRSTRHRKMESATFPGRVQISTRCAGWREAAIDGWPRNPMFYRVDD